VSPGNPCLLGGRVEEPRPEWMYRHSGGTAVRSHTTQGRSGAHALTIGSPYGQNLASPTWKVLGGYMRSDSEAVADAVQAGHPKARDHHSAEEDPAIQIDVEFNRSRALARLSMSVRLWILAETKDQRAGDVVGVRVSSSSSTVTAAGPAGLPEMIALVASRCATYARSSQAAPQRRPSRTKCTILSME
jgi:hypothetical protein